MAALLKFAIKYGPRAVKWVKDNAWWLVPLGAKAFEMIKQLFG